MSTFADSSALVKLYANEAGYHEIRQLGAIVIAQIARVEVPGALWRKQRVGELAAEHAQALTAEFEADYFGTDAEAPRFAPVATTPTILDGAAQLCATRGLRAYDAVQLSSAITARGADPECVSVAAFDQSLRFAAAAEGFFLVPAEVSP